MGENVFVISGLPGSGSSSVAKMLAQKLNLKYFTLGQLFKEVGRGTYKEKPYAEKFLELCAEKNLTIPRFAAENDTVAANLVWESDLGKNPDFHEAIDTLQQQLADKGDIVVEGKLSLEKIKNPSFGVWLHASFQKRASRIGERENISQEESESLLTKRQEHHKKEWGKIYGIDYCDQGKKADLVIDTSNLLLEEITERILHEAKKVNKPTVIGVTGPICSGTDSFVSILAERGFIPFSYSDEIKEEASQKGIDTTRIRMQDLGDEIRKREGLGALSARLLKKMKPGLKYVVGNIRNP